MRRIAAQGVLRLDESAKKSQWRDFGLAAPTDDAVLRRLMRENLMPGRISLGLECEPSYFDALSIGAYRCQAIVARESNSGHIMAMGTRSVRHMYLNGRVTSVGYLGHLRTDSQYRRRSRLRTEGYALARTLRLAHEAPFDLTCILADNQQARRLFTAGVRGVPSYVECDRIVTLAISTHRRVKQPGS